MDPRRVAGAILAGGRARRLGGQVKPLIEVGGRRILDRTLEVLAPLVVEVLLIGDPALLAGLGPRVVPDLRPGIGPLAGLEAALTASAAEAVLLVGGDMPFLDAATLLAVRDADAAASTVCFRSELRLEPLCARYARSLLPTIAARLDAGLVPLHALLDAVGGVRLAVTTPAERRALTNVNTADDLAAAMAAVGERC